MLCPGTDEKERKKGLVAMRVLVAGAGIGGLIAALSLIRRGFDVEVYEQAPTLGEIGAGFQIGANGARVLFALGLEEAIRQRYSLMQGKIVRLWSTGQEWKLFDLGEVSVQRYGFPYFMMHRADLHAILVDAVNAASPGCVRLNKRVTAVATDDRSATLTFADGTHAIGDVAVGADGVHSAMRHAMFGSDEPQFTGLVAWRAMVPGNKLPDRLMRPVGTNWIGPGRHIVHYPVRGGELFNFVAVVENDEWRAESWTQRCSREECAADFVGWHEDIQTVIGAIEEPYKWALIGREPMQRWSVGRATLLGDACHPTLPFLAQGANMAIEDGFVLARCLDAYADDPQTALQYYEAARVERASRMVRGSAENGRRFHSNQLSTTTEEAQRYVDREWQGGIIEERYDWLYRYDATTAPINVTNSCVAA